MATSQLIRNIIGDKTLLISSHSDNKVISLQNNNLSSIGIMSARGISSNDDFIAIASIDSIKIYNKKTGVFAGTINSYSPAIHEIKFIENNKIIASDPSNSSLLQLSLGSSSVIWTVPGVDSINADYRSLINGVCTENDLPKYVTVLGISNIPNGWRNEAEQSHGALIDVQNNNIVLNNLNFPHSPRIDKDSVWFLNSGLNQVCKWAPGDSDFTVVSTVHGWSRGLLVLDEYLLVGVSQGRASSMSNVISDHLDEPGIAVINKSTGEQLEFESIDVQEIFDMLIVNSGLS